MVLGLAGPPSYDRGLPPSEDSTSFWSAKATPVLKPLEGKKENGKFYHQSRCERSKGELPKDYP
jgi:hypothetical protein